MSAAANLPTLTDQPDPPVPIRASRSARLLGVIRKLIDYSKDLAATIRQRAFADPNDVSRRFGTADIARILAMIARGLHRANALEDRIVRRAAHLDAPPQAASSPRGPRARPPAAPAAVEATDPTFAPMPTPAQFAAEVLRRPIGAVIAEICRDLGIRPGDPIWQEVLLAIVDHDGDFIDLLEDIAERSGEPFAEIWSLAWQEPPASEPASPQPSTTSVFTRPP
jgi:hypothetical protein